MCGKTFLLVGSFFILGIFAKTEDNSPSNSSFKIIGNAIEKCLNHDELGVCLEEEAASVLGQAITAKSITLAPGLTLKQMENAGLEDNRKGRATEINPTEGIWHNLDRILTTRSLNIDLSEFVGNDSESRGKKKKIYRYVGVAIATAAAILIPLKLKIIGWMAATALFTGKLALVIASLVGLKKLVSKPHEETTHVHYDGHRSDDAHFLAYNAYSQPEPIVE